MNWLQRISKPFLIIFLSAFCFSWSLQASDEHGNTEKTGVEKFIPGVFIMDHVKDSHEWHILTRENGEHVSIYLPVILYSQHSGLHFFMSGKLAHGHSYKGFKLSEETGKILEINESGETIGIPLDLSITKTVAGMMIAAIFVLVLFLTMGYSYERTENMVPRGINGFLEPMVVFIRDEIALPNIGEKKYEKFMPYLLTVFFFILFNNILGLIPFFPFGANVTGNIAVTMVLALITFFITQFSGTRDHWKHVFATPGVPVWLLPIMIPVEIMGLFSKPFALMIRLFANISAGHIVVLSLVSLIFIFKALWVSAISIPMVLFIDVIEILVAFLQAYVFTLLSALFIGLAAKEHHHA